MYSNYHGCDWLGYLYSSPEHCKDPEALGGSVHNNITIMMVMAMVTTVILMITNISNDNKSNHPGGIVIAIPSRI